MKKLLLVAAILIAIGSTGLAQTATSTTLHPLAFIDGYIKKGFPKVLPKIDYSKCCTFWFESPAKNEFQKALRTRSVYVIVQNDTDFYAEPNTTRPLADLPFQWIQYKGEDTSVYVLQKSIPENEALYKMLGEISYNTAPTYSADAGVSHPDYMIQTAKQHARIIKKELGLIYDFGDLQWGYEPGQRVISIIILKAIPNHANIADIEKDLIAFHADVVKYKHPWKVWIPYVPNTN